jgi:FtsH-binding integral membrane protein
MLGLSQRPTSTAHEAISEGTRRDADAVLFGTLDVNGPVAQLDLHFADVRSGIAQPVMIAAARPSLFSSSASEVHTNVELHIFRRWVVWAIVALLLPIFTVGFLREVVRKESNRRNFFALTVYTTVDLLLLWLLMESTSRGWRVGSVLVGGMAVFFYNVSVMTWALKMEN